MPDVIELLETDHREVEQMFAEFDRATEPAERRAIADKIIRQHGGRLWVESEEGQGATFRFTLAPAPDPSPTKNPAFRRG